MPNKTKDGKPRKGKATATPARLHIRALAWEPVRAALQHHLQACKKGEASNIAKYVGCSPSQIHRWSCPICEHDVEPNFSQGYAIMVYLQFKRFHLSNIRTITANHPQLTITRK